MHKREVSLTLIAHRLVMFSDKYLYLLTFTNFIQVFLGEMAMNEVWNNPPATNAAVDAPSNLTKRAQLDKKFNTNLKVIFLVEDTYASGVHSGSWNARLNISKEVAVSRKDLNIYRR